MATINLDEARAARREAKDENIEVVFGGETFAIPPEMPFEMLEKLGPLRGAKADDLAPEVAEAVLNLFKVLLGEDQYTRFMSLRPSMNDLDAMLDGVFAEYGVALGESPASATS